MKKLFILFIAVAGFGVNSYAQTATSASAKIVAAIGITKNSDLNFGVITPGASATTVIQAADATVKATSAGATTTGASSAAKFTVVPVALSTYSIDFPATVNLVGSGTADMIATLSLSATAARTNNAETLTEFYIGGSLAVAAIGSQTAGTATGSFNVTIAYE